MSAAREEPELPRREPEANVTVRLPMSLIEAIREEAHKRTLASGRYVSVAAIIRDLIAKAF